MPSLAAINIQAWIADNEEFLKPPVGGKPVYREAEDFVVVMLGGNERTDWHVNPTEELFFQIEGEITLKVRENGVSRDVSIGPGEMLLLPPDIPHSPQRPEGTRGLVVERPRPDGAPDKLQWYCESCDALVYEAVGEIKGNLVGFINDATAVYIDDDANRSCDKCGHVNAAK